MRSNEMESFDNTRQMSGDESEKMRSNEMG